ncbi:hypothetical protein [Congregibacter litoralis]|uniref:SGNH hydrolase-type esterase domain-containing protein n=1 Tax=Congregibacter litoralis KT71 TaxID=314285 RepID=A4ABD1_9GAMM|nr:hypothetical protein [Congregibacter litoralis]EAQ96685.1 hypothetical protein KT71_06669 [Congregibacter litoralis KT71]
MPNETPIQRRRRLATNSGITYLSSDFAHVCKAKPDRIGIVAEGDSWFAYPKKWIAFGADMNIVHHLEAKVKQTDTVNLLRMASNGDEAVGMTSGKQLKTLYKVLKKNRDYVRLLMFSGGGNDIVGKNDMLPLLEEYTGQTDFKDCINMPRFEAKIEAIVLAYQRLIWLCEDVMPNAKIVTHTYDIAKPWDQGAEFFWGLIKSKPWVYPYLVRRNIPRKFHLPIIEFMLNEFANGVTHLAQQQAAGGRLVVTPTQYTLRPGSKKDWLNEIHPTEDGFEKIFKKVYAQMRQVEPGLPK